MTQVGGGESTARSRQAEIVAEFAGLSDWEARYRRIIAMGKGLAELPPEARRDEFKIKGCQSQVWLHARLEDGRVRLSADSDALLVRGLVALVLRVYSGARPAEILATPPDFVGRIGLESKLSPSRANGLHGMIKQIQYYAFAFEHARAP